MASLEKTREQCPKAQLTSRWKELNPRAWYGTGGGSEVSVEHQADVVGTAEGGGGTPESCFDVCRLVESVALL